MALLDLLCQQLPGGTKEKRGASFFRVTGLEANI
jgi:hypothetical protein